MEEIIKELIEVIENYKINPHTHPKEEYAELLERAKLMILDTPTTPGSSRL